MCACAQVCVCVCESLHGRACATRAHLHPSISACVGACARGCPWVCREGAWEPWQVCPARGRVLGVRWVPCRGVSEQLWV